MEIYAPYFSNRILNVLLEKKKRVTFQEPTIPVSSINKIDDSTYKVISQSDPNVIYDVDLNVGICSCPVGNSGKMCKHHLSILVHDQLGSVLLFQGTPDEKLKYCHVAVGVSHSPSIDFFQGMANKNQDHGISPSSSGIASSSTEPAVDDDVYSSGDEFADTVTFKANDVVDLSSSNKDLLTNCFNTIIEKFGSSFASIEASQAIEKYYSRLQAIKTPSQLMSVLHSTHSDSVPHRNSGRKIRVQPTGISRRTAGSSKSAAPLGKGRRPSCLRAPPAKRPRNLAFNVARNQLNAKSH